MADWQVDVFHTLVLHCPDRIHMHGLPPPGIQQERLDKDMYTVYKVYIHCIASRLFTEQVVL